MKCFLVITWTNGDISLGEVDWQDPGIRSIVIPLAGQMTAALCSYFLDNLSEVMDEHI